MRLGIKKHMVVSRKVKYIITERKIPLPGLSNFQVLRLPPFLDKRQERGHLAHGSAMVIIEYFISDSLK